MCRNKKIFHSIMICSVFMDKMDIGRLVTEAIEDFHNWLHYYPKSLVFDAL